MNQQEINSSSMLKVGTILRGIYRIDSYLSSGGFGNTYVATNIEFDERVAIKEFFMKGVTQRDDNQTTVSVSNTENSNSFLEQREKFKKEARRIRQLNNPHIVRVHDLFEENGTAYYVMDYVDGENLSDRLKRTGKPMTEGEVNQILPQILDALKSIHNAGIWHLDLKPANIMVDKAGNVKLIDFGASKQLNTQKGGATTSTAISYTNGYAPREQMEQNYDKFGPWTDIYALGATLYNLLTNKRPPLPTDIDDDMSEDKHVALPFPERVGGLRFLVLQMMKTNRLQRPQNVDAIIDAETSRTVKPKQAPKQQPTSQSITANDDEATIIAEPKLKKEEQKNASKEGHQATAQTICNSNQKEEENDNLIICPDCNGSGVIKYTTNGGIFGNMEYEGPCTRCNGTGHIKKKNRIDYTIPTYNKAWISILSVAVLCCIFVMITPALFFSQRDDEPLSATFESSPIFLFFIISNILFPILTSILYASLSKGIWKQNKDISVLMALCAFLELAKFGEDILVGNAAIGWCLFFGKDIFGLLCGIYILSRCTGNIVKLGKLFVTYFIINVLLNVLAVSGIYHDFDMVTYTICDIVVWGADLLWLYGMWWILTRKEVINESH